jgi:hypothetical protein
MSSDFSGCKYGANHKGVAALILSAQLGDVGALHSLLCAKAFVDSTFKRQRNSAQDLQFTPLTEATRAGHVTSVRLLLQAKADVNHRTRGGWTSLALACAGPASSLKSPASPHRAPATLATHSVAAAATDDDDDQATEGVLPLVTTLLKAKSDSNGVPGQRRPLMEAITSKTLKDTDRDAVVCLLLAAKASPGCGIVLTEPVSASVGKQAQAPHVVATTRPSFVEASMCEAAVTMPRTRPPTPAAIAATTSAAFGCEATGALDCPVEAAVAHAHAGVLRQLVRARASVNNTPLGQNLLAVALSWAGDLTRRETVARALLVRRWRALAFLVVGSSWLAMMGPCALDVLLDFRRVR